MRDGRDGDARSGRRPRPVTLAAMIVATAAMLAVCGGALAGSARPSLLRGALLRSTIRPTFGSSPGNASLASVACPSSSECWAVGVYQAAAGGTLNQVLHLHGKKWSLVTVPQPGGEGPGHNQFLTSVSCLTSSDCWAVGSYNTAVAGALNEALHWNGKKWKDVRAPNPSGTGSGAFNRLNAVTCESPSRCWAVGTYQPGTTVYNQMLRWGGKRWVHFSVPNPGGTGPTADNELYGAACFSTAVCWATGYASSNTAMGSLNQALRRKSGPGPRKWSKSKVPQLNSNSNYLYGVVCTAASNCWSTGGTSNSAGAALNESLRWNGKSWSSVKIPQPGGTGATANNDLFGVDCTSASDCWTVGDFNLHGGTLNAAYHWNGKRWSKVPPPAGPTGNISTLQDISCASSSNCWAVGVTLNLNTGDSNELFHWNGKKWSSP